MTLTIVVANLKGGSTKTTSAAFVLHALQEAGLTAIGVDADGENESLLRWSEAGEWTIPVIGLPVNDLHRKLPGIVGDRYDAVVVDTPPMKERLGVVASAIRLATHVLVPMAPTGIEYEPASRPSAKSSTTPQRCAPGRRPSSPWFHPTVPNAASTEVTDNSFATTESVLVPRPSAASNAMRRPTACPSRMPQPPHTATSWLNCSRLLKY